jgi:acetyl esterase/lipase
VILFARPALLICALATSFPQQLNAQTASTFSEDEVEVFADVVYGHKDGLALTFDVLVPHSQTGAAVIFVNSGGWRSPRISWLTTDDSGSARMRDDAEMLEGQEQLGLNFSPKPLLERGITMIIVRHGSRPRYTLPEIVSDIRLAVPVILDVAPSFGIDPDRVGLWGGSAGGHLALLGGTAIDQSEYLTESRIAAIVAYFPITDLASMPAPARPPGMGAGMGMGGAANPLRALGLEPGMLGEVSPVTFVSEDDPPTLIVHGDQDTTVPLRQGQLMHAKLSSAGVTTELIVVEGSGHGFSGQDSDTARTAMLNWFQQHLN